MNKHIVVKEDLEGNELGRFSSCKEAALDIVKSNEKLSTVQDRINKCCLGKKSSIGSFKYRYEEKKVKELPYKCPYCEKRCETYNGLCKHVLSQKKHGEKTREELLTDFKYNGVRPTCKCGCGQYTNISYVGEAHFVDYVKGHAAKIHNNWGHNEVAKQKSSETRRKQFKEGTRIQWNKGKKWVETYTEEQIEELMKMFNEERSKKISEKLKVIRNTEENKEKMRQKMIHQIQNKKFVVSSKLEDYFAQEYLDKNNINYKRQYYLEDIKQFCDFYIKELNTIIEIDGQFWHADPRFFPNGAIYESQKIKCEKDKIKNKYLKEKGYNLIRLWEYDIYHNDELIFNVLKENNIIK